MVLDTARALHYIAALARRGAAATRKARWTCKAFAVAVFLTATAASAAGEFKVRGVILPNGAVRVAENRYRLPDGFETSAKWYRQIYKPDRYPRRHIVNQPGVKAVHFANPNTEDEWSGFNLYEHQGEVRLFILVRDRK